MTGRWCSGRVGRTYGRWTGILSVFLLWGCGDDPDVISAGGFTLEPLLVIGDAGEGIIDQGVTLAEWRGGYAISHRSSPAQIQFFDDEGRFVEVLGSEGEGPREFKSIRALLNGPDGELIVVDVGNGRVTRLDRGGAVIASARVQWSPRPFIGGVEVFPDGDLLVNGRTRSSTDQAWVHRWSMGEVLWSLPEQDPIQEDGLREAAIDSDSSVWVVTARHRFRVDHLSPSGAVIDTWSPQRPWFENWREQEPMTPGADPHSGFWGPVAWIRDVRVEADELWVLAMTGDPRWRESRLPDRVDMGLFSNSVIDVYNKHTGELVASAEFDLPGEYLLGFLSEARVLGFRSGDLLNHLVVRRLVRE